VGAFGDKLRRHREQRGISLEAISNTTKISARMLRAIEDEHFDQLPGGVFNKGFVRAYARQVGLDEEETVGDYLAALRESQIEQQKLLPDFRSQSGKRLNHHDNGTGIEVIDRRERHRRNKDRRNQERRAPGSDHRTPEVAEPPAPRPVDPFAHQTANPFADRPLVRSHVDPPRRTELSENLRPETLPENRSFEDRSSGDHSSGPHASADLPDQFPDVPEFNPSFADEPATHPLESLTPASAPGEVPKKILAAALVLVALILAAWSHWHRAKSTQSLATDAAQSTPSTLVQPASGLAQNATRNTSQSASKPARTATPAPVPNSSSTPVAANQRSRPATPKPPATFTLLIRADKTTSVSIQADGQLITRETLIAPAHTSVRATREIVVKAGDATAVNFLLNGKLIASNGKQEGPGTFVFDAKGLNPPSAAASDAQ
jgi:cytoskeletal protein RodZ